MNRSPFFDVHLFIMAACFYLRDKDKEESPIFVWIRTKYVNVKYCPGINVRVKDWKNGRTKDRDTNNIIDRIDDTIRQMIKDGVPGYVFKDELDLRLDRSNKDFHSYYHVQKLKEFTPVLPFNRITYKLLSDFVVWMESKNYSDSYISKQIKVVKAYMKEAIRRRLVRDTDFIYFKYRVRPVDAVYLSEEELARIYNADLSPRLSVSRDIFIVGCFTGLRVQNYINLKADISKGYIETVINKGGGRIKIPVHHYIYSIYDKYGGFPPPVHHTRLNLNIKAICQAAGITEMVCVSRWRGGKQEELYVEKYKLISSHTARRSFATNMYLRGVPVGYIMRITGHRAESTCLKYIKAGLNDVYEKLAELDFWK